MSRKRTPDVPTAETETAASVAVTESTGGEDLSENRSFAERVSKRDALNKTPDPFEIAGDYTAGVRLFESRKDGKVALKFEEKPTQHVIDKLKEAGYRWNPEHQVWTHPVRRDSAMSTRIDAERLYQEVREMTRQEKGLDVGQEVPF